MPHTPIQLVREYPLGAFASVENRNINILFLFLSSKPLIQPYLQFWRLILKINVSTVSANATVCTWKVMTCMADSGTWYCLLSGRTYGTSQECSLSLKFRLFQKLDSLGFQLQKWRILTSKAINGEVSHHKDKYISTPSHRTKHIPWYKNDCRQHIKRVWFDRGKQSPNFTEKWNKRTKSHFWGTGVTSQSRHTVR